MPFLYWLLIIAAAVALLSWAFGRPTRVPAGGDRTAAPAPDAERGNQDASFVHDAARRDARDAEVAAELTPQATGGLQAEPELDPTAPPDSAAGVVLGEDRSRTRGAGE